MVAITTKPEVCMKIRILIIAFLTFVCMHRLSAQQQTDKDGILITGATIDLDDVQPVPFVTIFVKGQKTGTISDNNGYFTLMASAGDTIVFRSVGYRQDQFVLPRELEGGNFSLIHLMISEELVLDEVIVQPWPSVSEFTRAFMQAELPRDVQKRSFESQQKIEQLTRKQYEMENVYHDQWRYNKLYDMTGVIPPNNFINPVQWSNFIRDWKEGKYKKAGDIDRMQKNP